MLSERRLAGAVRADDRVRRPLVDLQVDVGERIQAGELLQTSATCSTTFCIAFTPPAGQRQHPRALGRRSTELVDAFFFQSRQPLPRARGAGGASLGSPETAPPPSQPGRQGTPRDPAVPIGSRSGRREIAGDAVAAIVAEHPGARHRRGPRACRLGACKPMSAGGGPDALRAFPGGAPSGCRYDVDALSRRLRRLLRAGSAPAGDAAPPRRRRGALRLHALGRLGISSPSGCRCRPAVAALRQRLPALGDPRAPSRRPA